MAVNYEHYAPVIVMALVIVFLGLWNPRCFQQTDKQVAELAKTGDKPASSLWIALLSLVAGALTVYSYNMKK